MTNFQRLLFMLLVYLFLRKRNIPVINPGGHLDDRHGVGADREDMITGGLSDSGFGWKLEE